MTEGPAEEISMCSECLQKAHAIDQNRTEYTPGCVCMCHAPQLVARRATQILRFLELRTNKNKRLLIAVAQISTIENLDKNPGARTEICMINGSRFLTLEPYDDLLRRIAGG